MAQISDRRNSNRTAGRTGRILTVPVVLKVNQTSRKVPLRERFINSHLAAKLAPECLREDVNGLFCQRLRLLAERPIGSRIPFLEKGDFEWAH